MASSAHFDFDGLPEELQLVIFEFLEPTELYTAVQTCRKWNHLVGSLFDTRCVLEPRRHILLRSQFLMRRRNAHLREQHQINIVTQFGSKITVEDEGLSFGGRIGHLACAVARRIGCDLDHLKFVCNGREISLDKALSNPAETEALSVYKLRSGDLLHCLLPDSPKWIWPLGPPQRYAQSPLHKLMVRYAAMPSDRYDCVASAVVKALVEHAEAEDTELELPLAKLGAFVDAETFDSAGGPPTNTELLEVLKARDQRRRITFVDVCEHDRNGRAGTWIRLPASV